MLGVWYNPNRWSQHTLDLLIVLGTVGAVVLALILALTAWVGRRRRRPKLRLSHDPRVDRTEEAWGNGHHAAFVRLAVTNARGRHAAEETEVLVVALKQIEARRDLYEETGVASWADGRRVNFAPLAWTHIFDRTSLTVAPSVRRTVDLGYLTDELYGTDPEVRLALAVNPVPKNYLNLIPPGMWEITVAVSARNADAVYYVFKLTFDGLYWFPKESKEVEAGEQGERSESKWDNFTLTNLRRTKAPK
jgi:hypothetical protein